MTTERRLDNTLFERINETMIIDRHSLRREFFALKKQFDEKKLDFWIERLQVSSQKVMSRKQSVPTITYEDSLPIAAKREEIKKAIRDNQVIIIAGETGSGKTTQLPKICLEIGRGIHGVIGHTQPRRLAARSVGSRVAEELATPFGDLVGYQVRFEDKSTDRTLVKLMTDGILLSETQHDRFLSRYDTIIVDEAHERSLNIDFLLGFLKILLPKRPDLKVIITSATIDLERFSKHFGDAPVIEVSGRTYSVDTWYRPLLSEVDEDGNSLEEDLSVDQGILAALCELEKFEKINQRPVGDVLVFLPGEREIRDTADILRKANLRHSEILPLYARLTPAEQQRIFKPSQTVRRVVLATNVAETSLTVPGIRYVIDSGTARISRYSYRAKVQRLPIEAISQASANQRKGRCGRIDEGICIRLYSEDDFLSRPLFTDPEILRTNLAAVILQMLHLRLGKIEDFPFIEAPESKAVKDGFTLLQEISAVTQQSELTNLGRQLARLPIDPRLGRMLIEGARSNVLDELLVITSALSIQDPRERPIEKQQAADQAHAQWKDPDSDFAALVSLWHGFEAQRQTLTANQLRSWCRRNFLNYLRLREWRDAHRQLLLICREMKLLTHQKISTNHEGIFNYDAVHSAILSGLLSHIGQKTEDGDYLGARQKRFWIHPSTGLAKKRPQWVMAAELVETTKLFARIVAKIEPIWLETLAAHLLKRSYIEPHWEKKRGQVIAFEQVTLYGLIIVGRRAVHYGPQEPVISRELFIREGLVRGEILSKTKCLLANRQLMERLDDLEAKARRRDIIADEETLYRYYDQYVPKDIYQTASFDKWYQKESKINPNLLIMTETDALAREASEITSIQFPDYLQLDGLKLPLNYVFEPGNPNDGVTIKVPAPLLPQLSKDRLNWLVPGLIEERAIALVRNLPKAIRKNFVPVPDFVKAALAAISFAEGDLHQSLGQQLLRMTGVRVTDEAWFAAEAELDNYLRMNFEVVDAQGKFLGDGRDLAVLTARFSKESQAALAIPKEKESVKNISTHSFDLLPVTQQHSVAGLSMTVYPALFEEGGVVKEGRFATRDEADFQHRRALQCLLLQQLAEQAKFLRNKLPLQTELGLYFKDIGRLDSLLEDILLASVDETILAGETTLPRDPSSLSILAEKKREDWFDHASYLIKLVTNILKFYHSLQKRLKGKIELAQATSLADVKQQLSNLISLHFVRNTPLEWLKEYPRYLKGIEQRLDKLSAQLQKDRVYSGELTEYWRLYQEKNAEHLKMGKRGLALQQYRWMLEEYRVSLFAQQLGTKFAISDKRLNKQWQQVDV